MVVANCLSNIKLCILLTSVNKNKTEKGIRWMPWYYEPMKDVITDETPRGAGK